MKLREYRAQNALSLQKMAARLNGHAAGQKPISASMVDRWEHGTIPRRQNLRRLSEATAGAVTVADFYAEEDGPPKRRRRATACSVVAARKAASTIRRRREAWR